MTTSRPTRTTRSWPRPSANIVWSRTSSRSHSSSWPSTTPSRDSRTSCGHCPAAEGRGERVIEGVFHLRARVEGNDTGYDTIAASGSNATVLHWMRNTGVVRKGDLLLLDAGVECNNLYTADVTRTMPINGKYSPAQRRIYELVLAAQQAGIDAVKPGATFKAPHEAAMKVLAQGLFDLGILKEEPEVALRPEQQLHRRYTLHGTSHMLGLDVHDCANARDEMYRDGVLEEGYVLTVEPGLYFQSERPHGARGVSRHRRAHRGRHPRHRDRFTQSLRGAAARPRRGRGVDGQALERGQPEPRVCSSA